MSIVLPTTDGVSITPIVVGQSFPHTVGMWFRLIVAPGSNAGIYGCFDNTNVTAQSLAINSISSQIMIEGGGVGIASIPYVVGVWTYIVGRWISATSRRLSTLTAAGVIQHVQDTASFAGVTAADTWAIGSFGFYPIAANCMIGEFFITNTDIQPDGGVLSNTTLRQLAFGGPFSLPHIRRDLVTYRSFRRALDVREDAEDALVYGRLGRLTYTRTGCTRGPHPPFLAPGYKRPGSLILPQWYELGSSPSGAPAAAIFPNLAMMGM